jgi:acetylornithine deacetylase/succinyl-diaminopimelate desuccinylase-like protein
MKGGIAMMLAAFLRARAERLLPAGDIILAVVCDEEAGSDDGARYLVENHPRLFDGTKYALGEFGGFTLHLGGKKFYPIQVAEKQVCWLKATIRGPAGHGAFPMHGGAMAQLGEALTLLDQNRLPVHVTPSVRLMCNALASALPFPAGLIMRQLLHPRLTNKVLKLLGNKGKSFDPLFHNTVNATIVRGGDKTNVIPSEIHLEMDGRLLPGYKPADLIAEIRPIVGNTAELEVIRHDPYPIEPDMGLFDLLAGVLREADPEGLPIPLVQSGFTDARLFARLGIQTYGFIPMNLPADFNLTKFVHAADERIPVESVKFGADAIYKVLQRYGK